MTACLLLSVGLLGTSCSQPAVERAYLDAALGAAAWLEATAIEKSGGLAWPVAPGSEEEAYRDRVSTDLYSGSAGVVLFFAELARATGDARYLELAIRGADHLLATLPEEPGDGGAGLYSGVAGVGFVLHRTGVLTGQARFEEGARIATGLIKQSAVPAGAGVEWGPVTDIVSGSAGTGLFLLYAGRHLQDPEAIETASAAGRRLLEMALPAADGQRWQMSPGYERDMPNFSHGTAGVAYLLVSLYMETGNEAFLSGALAGARHLLAIAEISDSSCRIHHHTPGGEELFYLSWCHGPAGTGRLFYRLYQATGDKEWLQWTRRAAGALHGVPRRSPGFWNNVGPCCGSAGVASFLLNVNELDEERAELDLVVQITDDLLDRATADEAGLKWIQAEHRVRPELLAAQTGYMQGAAGIGLWLLELDAALNGSQRPAPLPDSPFGGL